MTTYHNRAIDWRFRASVPMEYATLPYGAHVYDVWPDGYVFSLDYLLRETPKGLAHIAQDGAETFYFIAYESILFNLKGV